MAVENSMTTTTLSKGISNGVRLLICTQAIDLDDPVLGFFCHWVEEISKHSESVVVICLKEGRHNFPENVTIHSLGKEALKPKTYHLKPVAKLQYVIRFYRLMWKLRKEYDAVFVHMNQEYVLLGGKLWGLWGKRVVLWRNHKKGSFLTRLAGRYSHTVCYTSESAYVASFKNAVRMPIGIDTDFFKPNISSNPRSILSLGRLDPVKNAEVLVKALELLSNDGVKFTVDIYGDPTSGHEVYAHNIRSQMMASNLEGHVRMHAGITHSHTPNIYRSHALYVNLTPSGSFDKTIGEAMASGLIVIVANESLRGVIDDELIAEADSAESVSRALRTALTISEERRSEIAKKSRDYILNEHSLSLFIQKLERVLSS